MCELTGAQILLQVLENEGVDLIFGYPGGMVLPIYDEIYRNQKIKHILTRHEQGAAHAADAYARATGKVGVCLATSGPGATNLVTGIANAYMDSIPLVAITGQVNLELLGKDSFQEADITGITTPITKYNYLVKDVKELGRVLHEAFYIAQTGRPGPVLVDISKTVTLQKAFYEYPVDLVLPGYKKTQVDQTTKLQQAIELIKIAKKPLVFVGGGCLKGSQVGKVVDLVEWLGSPITYSLMGKSVFPDEDEKCVGMVGMHGTKAANYAMTECDLLLGIGVRFDDRVTGKIEAFAPNAKIIHIDIDPAELNKNIKVFLGIEGDANEMSEALLDLLKKETIKPDICSWMETIQVWKTEHPLQYNLDAEGMIKPQYVLEKIGQLTKGEAYVTTEVGQNQMWSAQYYPCKNPRTFISSGGLGTMGFGLPAAMGVQFAHPDAVVFAIAGDGSIQMNSQELATIVENQLPLNIVILNNHNLGMVRQWQKLFFEERYSYTGMSGQPDFVKLAEAYGAVGVRITRVEEVEKILKEAINSPKPYVIDVIIDPNEDVFPMVPAGGALNNMLGG
jgi:acetolactate synthase-1/2/3 large subunit